MYREMLGAAAELEAVRNMIQYRRRSLITGNDNSFPAVETLHA
jgi:hypothetical protein